MTDHHNVQDENLIDDQVLQDLGASTAAPAPAPAAQPEPAAETLIPAPTGIGVTPQNQQVDNTPATPVADQPTGNPLLDEMDEPTPEPKEENNEKPAKPAKAHATALGHGNGDDDELLDVKKKALEDLSPLVDKLELGPKERFQTLMEILQASDDRTLVKPALEAAEAIEDESERAQALLDVVNEVNYLTQEK